MARKRMLTQFDEKDLKALDEAVCKFVEHNRSSSVPGFSPDADNIFLAYTSVLTLALLKAQYVLERLTWILVVLTVVLAVLTGVQIVLLTAPFFAK